MNLATRQSVQRYARQQIEIDPSVATVGISGVFNAGDASLHRSVTAYFPCGRRTSGSTIRLTAGNRYTLVSFLRKEAPLRSTKSLWLFDLRRRTT